MNGFMQWCLGAFIISMVGLGVMEIFEPEADLPNKYDFCKTEGGYWHCSHHPMTYEYPERLECVDKHCEVKIDRKTGDKFKFMEIRFENWEKERGYLHVHD